MALFDDLSTVGIGRLRDRPPVPRGANDLNADKEVVCRRSSGAKEPGSKIGEYSDSRDASAIPYTAAAPIVGAPRTVIVRIASATSFHPGGGRRIRVNPGKRSLINHEKRMIFW